MQHVLVTRHVFYGDYTEGLLIWLPIQTLYPCYGVVSRRDSEQTVLARPTGFQQFLGR